MHTSELSYYRPPVLKNVTWLTPQQLDARRNVELPPVQVREIKPLVRPQSSDEVTDANNLIASAPQIFARARATGLIKQKFEPVVAPGNKGVHSPRTLRRHARAARLVRSQKFWNNHNKTTQE